MSSQRTWKLKAQDGTLTEFKDIRRKVGNQIIRAYLLERILATNRLEKVKATLRGPKGEFKDFDNFFVLKTSFNSQLQILVEANVYENLRIVGTDSNDLANMNSNEIIALFTKALDDLDSHQTSLVLSETSNVHARKG